MLFMILLLGAISFDFLVFVACRLLHSAILFPNIPEYARNPFAPSSTTHIRIVDLQLSL